jgi:hypothetical protein
MTRQAAKGRWGAVKLQTLRQASDRGCDEVMLCAIREHTQLLVIASILRGHDNSFQLLWSLKLESAEESGQKFRICAGSTALSAAP